MKLKSILPCICLLTGCLSTSAFAQDFINPLPAERGTIEKGTPVDGQMIRLDAKQMWRFSYLPNLKLLDSVEIAQDMAYPSISPDGSRVVMFKKDELNGNSLQEWKLNSKEMRELVRGDDVSNYITWDDNMTLSMRERSKPFFRDGAKLRYNIEPQKVTLRDRKPLAEASFVAYDVDDVIILESKKTQTLQAISDSHADRYYAPVVSPDERFVAFCGLTGGVYLFDIDQNAVVFIGNHGTSPAFSPDGRYLIYTTSRDNGHNVTSGDFILIDLDKRSYRYISNPNKEIRVSATLSRDASEIAYSCEDGKIFKASLPLVNKAE